MRRGLYLRVGALILTGLVLATAFVLFFTAGRLGRDAQTFETYVRESVQGLEVGAAVRFRGVALGRVTEISLVASEYDPPPGPLSEAYRRVLVRFALDLRRFRDAPDLESAVASGLRVRLSTTGITGVGYLELDFADPARSPLEIPPWTPRAAFVPAQPSTVSQVTTAAEALVERLGTLPLETILSDAAGLLTDLRSQVSGGDAALALREAAETLATLRAVLEGSEVPALAGELRATVAELRGTAAEARALLASAEIQATLRNAQAASEQARAGLARLPGAVGQIETAARSASGLVRDLNADLSPVLRDLRAASGNLRDTTELLRRNPGATILAPAPPPPAWSRGGSR